MGKKKIVVEGIPNIRLSNNIKDRIRDALENYAIDQYRMPSKDPIYSWLQKISDEAFPKEDREILGKGRYGVAAKRNIKMCLYFDANKKRPYFNTWGSAYHWQKFDYKAFDFCDYDFVYDDDTPSFYLTHYINDRIDQGIIEYEKQCRSCQDAANAFQEKWNAELWGASYFQELQEDMQVLLKDIILEFFDETDRDFRKFIEKVKAK